MLSGIVETAPEAMHGRLSHVQHTGPGLFADVPQDFSVVRYHSLAVTGPLGPEGRVTAWTEDGVVMGIEHTRRPLWGVQFHPESIASEHGRAIVKNFYDMASEHRPNRRAPAAPAARPGVRPPRRHPATLAALAFSSHIRTLDVEPPTELVFQRLFGAADHAFWLDSADAPTRLAQASYLGTSTGAEECLLHYDIEAGQVTVTRAGKTVVETRLDLRRHRPRYLPHAKIEPPEGIAAGLHRRATWATSATSARPTAALRTSTAPTSRTR